MEAPPDTRERGEGGVSPHKPESLDPRGRTKRARIHSSDEDESPHKRERRQSPDDSERREENTRGHNPGGHQRPENRGREHARPRIRIPSDTPSPSPSQQQRKGRAGSPPRPIRKPRRRRRFTDEEVEKVKAFFGRHIEERDYPPMSECRDFLETYKMDHTAKNVQDKVRNLAGR